MKIVVAKKDLVNALDRVRSTVSSSKMIDYLRCFCFRQGCVQTYNGQAGTTTPIALDGADFCIEADKFYRLVSSLFDTIELELKEKGHLIVKSGKNKTTIAISETKAFPHPYTSTLQPFSDATNFVEGLRRVALSIGTNATKPELLGVGVRGDFVFSADGKRISRFRINKPIFGEANLPADAVNHLVRLGQPDRIQTNGNQIFAIYDATNTTYVSTLLAKPFPFAVAENAFTAARGDEDAELPGDFSYALDRVKLMAPEEDTDVILENSSIGLSVSTASEVGSGYELLDWTFQKPFKVCVDPSWLKKAVEASKTVDLKSALSEDARVLRFFHEDGFEHLLCLKALRE